MGRLAKSLLASLVGLSLFSCSDGEYKLSNGMLIPDSAIRSSSEQNGVRTIYLNQVFNFGGRPIIIDDGKGEPYTIVEIVERGFGYGLGKVTGRSEKRTSQLTYKHNNREIPIWQEN